MQMERDHVGVGWSAMCEGVEKARGTLEEK